MCQTGGQRAKLRAVDLAVGDVVIARDVVIHPLLGDALIICDRSGEPLTAMSVVDLAQASAEPRLSDECQGGLQAFFDKRPAPWS